MEIQDTSVNEMHPLKIKTTYNGIYEIAPAFITHFLLNDTETSCGLLVTRHCPAIEKTFQITDLMSRDLVYESVAYYWHEDSELEEAPHLIDELDMLEDQLNIFTDGAYKVIAGILAKGDTTTHKDREQLGKYKYLEEINSIWWEIFQLRDGRYYETSSLIYKGQRGIPRISTVGRRLTDRIIELVWKMDSNLPNRTQEMRAMLDSVPDALSEDDDDFSEEPDSVL